jgi:hypothetical protein
MYTTVGTYYSFFMPVCFAGWFGTLQNYIEMRGELNKTKMLVQLSEFLPRLPKLSRWLRLP